MLASSGCLSFVRLNQSGRPLNNGKGFSKISKPTEQNGTDTICNLISFNCFQLMRHCKLESLANCKEISAVPFQTEKEDRISQFLNGISRKLPYHLTSITKISGFSGQMVSTQYLPGFWCGVVRGFVQDSHMAYSSGSDVKSFVFCYRCRIVCTVILFLACPSLLLW